jgi:hypothetical protein
MKIQKSMQTTPTRAEGPSAKSNGSGAKGLVLHYERYSPDPADWPRPTELQLANLAVRLARTEKIDAKQLVEQAWGIYMESCSKVGEDYRQLRRLEEVAEREMEDFDDVGEGLPQPKKYPVTFRQMELLLLPKLKGRTADRAALFREYLFAEMVDRSLSSENAEDSGSYWDYVPEELEDWKEAAKDEVAREFGKCKRKVYDAQSYARFGASFLRWFIGWTHRRNSEARAANALKGWEKRREAMTAKTGAHAKWDVLRQILDGPLKKPPSGA